MNPAKIRLSKKEMELLTNADWILTKNGIIQKVKQLLESLLVSQQEYISLHPVHLPEELLRVSPKISRGENYLGLPYLILDHPRYFDKTNIAAIRTFFWWGNFFSTTLHLSGDYKKKWEDRLVNSFRLLQKEDYSISVHKSEWEHHFEKENYISLKDLSKNDLENQLRDRAFIKLAKKTMLNKWDDAGEILLGNFKRLIGLIGMIAPNSQAGGIIP
jgi:hypothetical protein